MKKNKITFNPIDELSKEWSLSPVPAKKYLPEWYKSMSLYSNKNVPGMQGHSLTLKGCQPFLDAISSGYYILLNADVVVSIDKDNNHIIEWRTESSIVSVHTIDQVMGVGVSNDYSNFPFKWNNFYVIKTPKNYSSLFIHPVGFNDLPFTSFSGVVDTDQFNIPVHFPFLIKKDFEGVIKRGTPIIQVIPFKRDQWKMEIGEVEKNIEAKYHSLLSSIRSSYKKNFWSKKYYE